MGRWCPPSQGARVGVGGREKGYREEKEKKGKGCMKKLNENVGKGK